MQKITKTEIRWIIRELDKSICMAHGSTDSSLSGIERGLLELRSEQLKSLTDRLQKVLDGDDKRISVV